MHWTETIVLPSGEKSPAFPIRPRPVPLDYWVLENDWSPAVWRTHRFRVSRRWRMA